MKTTSNDYGTVIIINGASAVGKSSIVKVFQTKQATPWLSAGIDNLFARILPQKFYLEAEHNDPVAMPSDAFKYKKATGFAVKIGPNAQTVIKGMHRAIASYAHAGNNVIVDYIKYDDAWIPDLKEALHGIKVFWIGINASLASIEQREKTRGTSPIGHARSHYDTVHLNISYDLMINTNSLSPDQAADQIITFIRKQPLR